MGFNSGFKGLNIQTPSHPHTAGRTSKWADRFLFTITPVVRFLTGADTFHITIASLVRYATGTGMILFTITSSVRFSSGAGILFNIRSKTAGGPMKSRIGWNLKFSFRGSKGPEREDDTRLITVEIKNKFTLSRSI